MDKIIYALVDKNLDILERLDIIMAVKHRNRIKIMYTFKKGDTVTNGVDEYKIILVHKDGSLTVAGTKNIADLKWKGISPKNLQLVMTN